MIYSFDNLPFEINLYIHELAIQQIAIKNHQKVVQEIKDCFMSQFSLDANTFFRHEYQLHFVLNSLNLYVNDFICDYNDDDYDDDEGYKGYWILKHVGEIINNCFIITNPYKKFKTLSFYFADKRQVFLDQFIKKKISFFIS